ncbi:MAG: hypothetical protein ABI132_11645 [Rhodanobacteraceae bacterium]
MLPRTILFTALVGLCGLGATSAQELSVPGVQPQQLEAVGKSERILAQAEKRKGLLAQYQVMRYAYAADTSTAFHVIFGQYLSWYQTFIGDYPDALQSFSIREKELPDDAPAPIGAPGYHVVPAASYLSALARNYKAVFFNEAHNVPLTRSLTVGMLSALREEGFNTFAAETLYATDKDLQERGYPIADSGFYTREPVYAEMVRTALKLGYKVVAYEADDQHIGAARELQQAQHLAQLFKDNPNTRLVVNGGYAHILEQGHYLGSISMAEHFRKLTDIDPLTIEQTMMISHNNSFTDHPYYSAVIAALHAVQPVVFIDKDGKPWSLRPGYDVSVIFPMTQLRRGRPTWLTLGGLRTPYFVDGTICQNHWPCLVEARYADEGADAIPADRTALDPVPLMKIGDVTVTSGTAGTAGIPSSQLYLRPGRYRLTAVDADGHVLTRQNIAVGANAAENP